MKTSILLALIFFGLNSFSNPSSNQENSDSQSIVEMTNINLNKMFLPYAENKSAELTEVIKKGEYSIYRCERNQVKSYPNKNIFGKNYHYFVYKNGQFHLTVNEYNKNHIYDFFTTN